MPPMFQNKTWLTAPCAYPVDGPLLERIGHACTLFYQAIDRLYYRSSLGQSLLRNHNQMAPWVAQILDLGKPNHLVAYAKQPHIQRSIPSIIRPDLLWTKDGWKLTELDSVPGGIGLNAYFYQLYHASDSFLEGWYHAICAARPQTPQPVIAIVISKESADYLPECEWLAQQLQARGYPVWCVDPESILTSHPRICIQTADGLQAVDIVYRFFELFDWQNISCLTALMEAEANGSVTITPPIKPHQEEKLNLALLHHPDLQAFWQEHIPAESHTLLKSLVPPSWILDFTPLPPGAYFQGPVPLKSWLDLAHFPKAQRQWILKISGFHPTAWGARGVTLANDIPQDVWSKALDKAYAAKDHNPYILQTYMPPARVTHWTYDSHQTIVPYEGRLRLCPYYGYMGTQTAYLGALATICPLDKKIIHGMQSAHLMPGTLT